MSKPFDKIEMLETQPSGNPGWFERLVERLAIAVRDSYSGGAECSTEADMRRARKDARTVLVELAKMGAEIARLRESLEWHKANAIAATVELGHPGKTLEEAVRETMRKIEQMRTEAQTANITSADD